MISSEGLFLMGHELSSGVELLTPRPYTIILVPARTIDALCLYKQTLVINLLIADGPGISVY